MIGYDAIRQTVGFVRDMERYVLDVGGSRAERVLGGLLTQTTAGVADGRQGRYAFFLDPKGRVVADGRLLPHPEHTEPPGFRLDLPVAARASIDAHLAKYVPPIFAEIAPAGVGVMSLLGPAAGAAWTRAADALGADDTSGTSIDEEPLSTGTWTPPSGRAALVVRREPIEVPGVDLYVPEDDVERVADALDAAARALGGGPADLDAWDDARIEAGLPVFGRELGPDRLAQEAGQDARAIAFDKGCYTGQEVVARIHYRGHVNRHLRGIRFETSDAPGGPAAGAELFHDGRPVGLVTSRTETPALGPIALAYVRREIEPGTRLGTAEAGPAEALVCELPFTQK